MPQDFSDIYSRLYGGQTSAGTDFTDIYSRMFADEEEDFAPIYRDLYKNVPQYQSISLETQPYASLSRRFFEKFAEGLTPFGWYESDLGKPENVGEIVADVAGGLTGFVAGFIPIGLVTGGVGVPLKAAGALSKLKNAKQLNQALKLVTKAGKAKTKELRRAYSIQAAEVLGVETGAQAIRLGEEIAGQLPRASGLLSRVPGYTNFILKTAINSPKTARAFNAGISNVVSFGIHGQMHVPLQTTVSDRMKQLSIDAATGIAFTVAGLPTTLGAKAPWKYTEPVSLFGIGAGGDLGLSDMSMTERIAHGLGLVAFHYGMSGIRRLGVEEKQIQALRDIGYPYEDAWTIVKSARHVNDAVFKKVEQASEALEGTIFLNERAADTDSQGKIAVQVTPGFITPTKKGNFQLRGIYTMNEKNPERVGTPFIIEGSSYTDVRRKFTSHARRADGSGGHGFIMPVPEAKIDVVYDVPEVTEADKKLASDYRKKSKRIDELRDIREEDRGYDIEPVFEEREPKKIINFATDPAMTIQKKIREATTVTAEGISMLRDKAGRILARWRNVIPEVDDTSTQKNWADMDKGTLMYVPYQEKQGSPYDHSRVTIGETVGLVSELEAITRDKKVPFKERERIRKILNEVDKTGIPLDYRSGKSGELIQKIPPNTMIVRVYDPSTIKRGPDGKIIRAKTYHIPVSRRSGISLDIGERGWYENIKERFKRDMLSGVKLMRRPINDYDTIESAIYLIDSIPYLKKILIQTGEASTGESAQWGRIIDYLKRKSEGNLKKGEKAPQGAGQLEGLNIDVRTIAHISANEKLLSELKSKKPTEANILQMLEAANTDKYLIKWYGEVVLGMKLAKLKSNKSRSKLTMIEDPTFKVPKGIIAYKGVQVDTKNRMSFPEREAARAALLQGGEAAFEAYISEAIPDFQKFATTKEYREYKKAVANLERMEKGDSLMASTYDLNLGRASASEYGRLVGLARATGKPIKDLVAVGEKLALREGPPPTTAVSVGSRVEPIAYELFPETQPKEAQSYKARLYVVQKGKKSYIPDGLAESIMSLPTAKGEVPIKLGKADMTKRVNEIWMTDEGLIASSEFYRKASLRVVTPEQAAWRNARTIAREVVRDTGIADNELRIIIRDFFPEAILRGRKKGLSLKGSQSLSNMTKNELDVFTAMFSPDTGRRYFDDTVMRAPPDRHWSIPSVKTRQSLSKWLQLIRNKVLPFYTELRLLGAKALSGISLNFELLRQQISGEGAVLYKHLRKMGIKRRDVKFITMDIDPKYKDGLRGELARRGYTDNVVEAVIKTVRDFADYDYVYLVASGNEIRIFNKQSKEFEFKPIFELQDAAEHIIELPIPKGDTKNFPEVLQIKTEKASVHKGKTYEGDIVKETLDSITIETKDLKRIEINHTDIIDGGRRTEWDLYKTLITRIATHKGKKSAPRVVTDKHGVKRNISYKNSTIFYEPHYLTRILTPEMRTMLDKNSSFREKLAAEIIEHGYDPEFVDASDIPRNDRIRAMVQKLNEMNSYEGQRGVFGQMFGRLADLPPALLLDANRNMITINPKENRYSGERWGYNVKKGDRVVDVEGKEHVIDKVIEVYERNFEKVTNRYQSMVANIVPTYKYIGRGGARNADFKTEFIEPIRGMHGDSVARWVEKGLELQINGQIKSPVANLLNKTTSFTAAIGLSSPLSGIKNILLGQANIIAGFGLRSTLASYHKLLGPEGRQAWTEIARSIGATEVGVHEMLTTPYSKYSPGLMYPTEITNRIIAATVGDVVLNASVDALTGRKSPLFTRVSKATASDFIEQTFKLDPGKIMKRGWVTNSERAKALQMAHLFTQGGPSMPFVPPWMQKQIARPLTLFYRIAYRVTDHVVTNVMRPLMVRGNPMPMLRYAGAAAVTGKLLYSMYYNAMDKEVVNKFRGMPYQYWMQFIKGEGFAILSNGFDQYGTIVETYQPVIFRTYSSLAKNMAYIIAGKKGAVQGTTDWFTENVVIWNHSRQVYERFAKPYNHAFRKSRRQQRQFLEATFGTGWMARSQPGDDYLTTRTPYYKDLKDVFWSEDGRDKAKVYYVALEYITHDIERQRASIGKSVRGSRAEAKAILKRIISNRRPIPIAWKTRRKGEKTTMYRLYMNALTPEEQLVERELENVYRNRKQEFYAAIREYRKEYDFSI